LRRGGRGCKKMQNTKDILRVFFKVCEEEGTTTSLSEESTKYKKRRLFWYPTTLWPKNKKLTYSSHITHFWYWILELDPKPLNMLVVILFYFNVKKGPIQSSICFKLVPRLLVHDPKSLFMLVHLVQLELDESIICTKVCPHGKASFVSTLP
jgi:hypothetical protein